MRTKISTKSMQMLWLFGCLLFQGTIYSIKFMPLDLSLVNACLKIHKPARQHARLLALD